MLKRTGPPGRQSPDALNTTVPGNRLLGLGSQCRVSFQQPLCDGPVQYFVGAVSNVDYAQRVPASVRPNSLVKPIAP